jgi:2-succinyl-5-enolpyruvyl-6-hydroxy-3-cyclohexene-1-carboxylate synthase
MRQTEKKHVQELIRTLVQMGLRHVVISPGSRNAPLSYSFAFHPDVETHTVVDERSAAFIALGMAQTLKEPVAVICTSGSAAINYGPAVAEAYYQHIPLLVLTADRPKELIDQGIGQSIRQPNMYANYVKGSFELEEVKTNSDSLPHARGLINEAWNLCVAPHQGPVHINVPMREPLYGMAEVGDSEPRIKKTQSAVPDLTESHWSELQTKLEKSVKTLVILGQMQQEIEPEVLGKWAKKNSAIVLTETTCNLSTAGFFPCIDQLIMSMSEEQQENFVPDLLITAGHNLISRKIKSLLKGKVAAHWHVDVADKNLDTFQCLTATIPVPVSKFLSTLADFNSTESTYHSDFQHIHSTNKKSHSEYLKNIDYSDLSVFSQFLPALPTDSMLQMGNSSVVRYIQLFESRTDIEYKGNRGVSGIDGCTSTAVGAAAMTKKPVTLITGDLAFFYDANGLWNKMVPDNLKIIIVNNSGGGIFRIIDGPGQSGALEEVFEVPHNRTAKMICQDHEISYKFAHSAEELNAELKSIFNQKGAGVLEVFTPREVNDKVLKGYFKFLKKSFKKLK